MSSYRLMPRDGSVTFQKIMHGRRWVGRVAQHADGDYVAVIKGTGIMIRRPTAVAAFEQAVAEVLGYPNAEAIRENNRIVSRQRRASKARARHAFNEMLAGNFKPLDELFGIKEK